MISKNPVFAAEFFTNLKLIYEEVEPVLNDNSNKEIRYKFVILCCLCVLYNQIYRNLDKKFFKNVWDAYKKAPIVNLCGTVSWYSGDFFLATIPNLARQFDKNPEQSVKTIRQTYYQTKVQMLPKAFQQSFAIVNLWLIKMQSLNDLSVKACLTYDQIFLEVI